MRSIAGEEGLVSLLKTAFDGFNVVNQNPLIEVGWLIVYKFSTDVFSMLKFNTFIVCSICWTKVCHCNS